MIEHNSKLHFAGLLVEILLAGVSVAACQKSDAPCRTDEGTVRVIEFSARSCGLMATRASSQDSGDILGIWDPVTSTFKPGAGIGVFAFYQKAKSNGYPVNFSGNFTRPDHMYNQKLEAATTDGSAYSFSYSPRKYWPNNANDRLSFFAYAPYDATAAWEDMKMEASQDGSRITRHYRLQALPEEQTDWLWADPVLNLGQDRSTEPIAFSFRHICPKLGVSCRIDVDDDDAYVTVDRVVLTARFNDAGDMVYRTASGVSGWENLEVSYTPVDYVIFDEAGPARQRVRTQKTHVGGDSSYLFPLPGTQDITVTATLTKNRSDGSSATTVCSRTVPTVNLKEGNAYDLLLDIDSNRLTFD